MALSITEHSRAIRVELLPTKTHFACDAGGITPYKSIHHPSTPPPILQRRWFTEQNVLALFSYIPTLNLFSSPLPTLPIPNPIPTTEHQNTRG